MIRALLSSLIACVFAFSAAAQEGAAYILVLEGAVKPAIKDEAVVQAGHRMQLAPDAVILLVHHATCEEWELKGGAVVIQKNQVRTRGSEILARIKDVCGGQVTMKNTNAVGAVTLTRGSNDAESAETLRAGPRPSFRVPGSDLFSVNIYQDGREIAELPIKRGRANWPKGAAPLTIGEDYQFAVSGAGAQHRGGGLKISKGAPRLVLLRN